MMMLPLLYVSLVRVKLSGSKHIGSNWIVRPGHERRTETCQLALVPFDC